MPSSWWLWVVLGSWQRPTHLIRRGLQASGAEIFEWLLFSYCSDVCMSTCVYMYMCVHSCTHVCPHTCVPVHMCMPVHVCVCVGMHAHFLSCHEHYSGMCWLPSPNTVPAAQVLSRFQLNSSKGARTQISSGWSAIKPMSPITMGVCMWHDRMSL